MTTTLVDFLTKVSNLVDDNISGTTTSDGATNKTSFVDSALTKYDGGYFGNPERDPQWWAYVGTELRSIKTSQGNGTVTVHSAFSSKVTSGTAYSIHKYDRDKKIVCSNQALVDAYPYFYKRVEDESTLEGKGSGDTEYTVPAAFVDFPDEIWEKYVSGTTIYYTQITDYKVKEISGTKKFYANITDGYPILLVGKTYLTQFTDDDSETELNNAQANVVALLAASQLCRMLSATVNATDSGRFDSLAFRYETKWETDKYLHRMPLMLTRRLDFSWAAQ